MSHASERQPALDWMRGGAALAVVLFHYFYKGPKEAWIQATLVPGLSTLASYGYLGVHLFFMISGYVILMSAQGSDWRRFAASRISRLAPAMWVCAPVTALALTWVAGTHFQVEGVWQLPANLTLLPWLFGQAPMDGSYWSLEVEIRFYFLVALILLAGQLRHIEGLLLVWLALSVLNLLRPMYPLQLHLCVQWAPLFAAGAWFHLVRQSGWSRRRRIGLGLSFVLACLYALQEAGVAADGAAALTTAAGLAHAAVVLMLITVFFLAFGRWVLPRTPPAPGALSNWMGGITYPLYLIHQYAGYALFDLALAQGWVSQAGQVPVLVAIVVLMVLFAWFVNRQVERRIAPWLRGVLAGRTFMPSYPRTRT